MCTKMILGCLSLLFVVGYGSACNDQTDCPLTHCCAKKAFVENEYNCVPYRQKYEVCLPGGLSQTLFDKKYDITCPCVPGLLCQDNQISDGRGGYIATGFPTCRDVTEDRIFMMRQKEMQSNSIIDESASSASASGASAYSDEQRRK